MTVDPYQRDAHVHGLQVLEETTTHRPGLAAHNDRLWVAWTGTDRVGRINIASLDQIGGNLVDKQTFPWTSVSGPTLVSYAGLLMRPSREPRCPS